jgi:fructokinase
MRIGVDVGGTKIEAAALDDGGRFLTRKRVATPRDDYHATLGAIVGLVREVENEQKATGTVGIGIPGVISQDTGLVKNANSTWLNGRPLGRDLERALERPLRIANDANCFALSEAVDGAASGAPLVFGVILGTGAGGGIVVDGHVLTGRNSIAGEWGHNPMPWPEDGEWPGPRCYCGRTGCIELFVSGGGLARDHRESTGRDWTAIEIADAAGRGDAGANKALDRHERRLARALASVLNVVDPDVVVLGGGLSNVERLYTAIPSRLTEFVFSDRVHTRIVPPRHGDSSGVRGAAWLWRNTDAGVRP